MQNQVLNFIFLFIFWGIIANIAHSQTRYLDEIFPEVEILKDIEYGEAINYLGINQKLRLDIYLPKNDTTTRPRPCIIWAHGGAFVVGTKDQIEIAPFPLAFAKRGFVCASIQYRLGIDALPNASTIYKMMIRALQDAKASVRFFRANAGNFNIDTSHIFFGGSSAGGITALNLGYLSNLQEFQSVHDSTLIIQMGGLEGGNNGNIGYSSVIHGVIGLCAAIPDIHWMNLNDIPVALVHGENDNTVPIGYGNVALQGLNFPVMMYGSAVIDSFAKTQNISSDFKILYGKGHTPYAWEPAYADTVIQFLAPVVYKWLGNPVSKSTQHTQLCKVIFDNLGFYVIPSFPYDYHLVITDIIGKIYYQSYFTSDFYYSFNGLPNGIYLLKIYNIQNQGFVVYKWVKN